MNKKIAIRLSEHKLREINKLVNEIGSESRNRFIIDAIDYYIEQYHLTKLM